MQYATKADFENGSLDNMGSVGTLITYIFTFPQVSSYIKNLICTKTYQ